MVRRGWARDGLSTRPGCLRSATIARQTREGKGIGKNMGEEASWTMQVARALNTAIMPGIWMESFLSGKNLDRRRGGTKVDWIISAHLQNKIPPVQSRHFPSFERTSRRLGRVCILSFIAQVRHRQQPQGDSRDINCGMLGAGVADLASFVRISGGPRVIIE